MGVHVQVLGQKLEFANAPLRMEKKQDYLTNKIAERKAKGTKVRAAGHDVCYSIFEQRQGPGISCALGGAGAAFMTHEGCLAGNTA